jgi:hypothetical protein
MGGHDYVGGVCFWAMLLAVYAGVPELMAAGLAMVYVRSDQPAVARLYWVVFWLTIAGHVFLLIVHRTSCSSLGLDHLAPREGLTVGFNTSISS